MKKDAKTGQLSQTQLQKAFQTSIKSYAEKLAADTDASRAQAVLSELKQELSEQEKQKNEILEKAKNHANLMVKLGFAGSMAQLVGFTLGIYVFYDWNEMEPYTWIFRKFFIISNNLIDCYSLCRGVLSHGRFLLLSLVKVRLGLYLSLQQYDSKQVGEASEVGGIRDGSS